MIQWSNFFVENFIDKQRIAKFYIERLEEVFPHPLS
jgi:hypothetical protein